jgi:hypothetical protein
MIHPLAGASNQSVAVFHIKPIGETNVPIIVTFKSVQVGHTTTLICLLWGGHITGNCRPGELGLLLSLPAAKTGHVI